MVAIREEHLPPPHTHYACQIMGGEWFAEEMTTVVAITAPRRG